MIIRPSDVHMRRMHPMTIALGLADFFKRMGTVLLPIIILSFGRGGFSMGDRMEIFLTGFGALGIVGSFLRYQFTRFGIIGDNLIYRTGWLNKQERTIPLDRIQNIDVTRSILHRGLGIADLKIDTGAAGAAEVTLSALGVEEAEQLRRELLNRKVGDFVLSEEAPHDVPLYHADLKNLMIAGITGNAAGLIAAFFISTVVSPMQRDVLGDFFSSLVRQAKGDIHNLLTLQNISTSLGIFVLLILAGWILNMGRSIVNFFGFTVKHVGDRLTLNYGLFTQTKSSLLIRRIQTLYLSSGWAMNVLGYWEVKAFTAGGSVVVNQEGEQKGPVTSNIVAPVLPDDRMPEFGRLLLPGLDLRFVRWLGPSPRVIRKWVINDTIAWVFVFAVAAWFLGKSVLWGLPFALAASYYGLWRRYHSIGFARQGDFVLFKRGWLSRELSAIPVGKVQSVSLTQSWLDRVFGLGNVVLGSAALGRHVIELEHLRIEDARDLYESVVRDAYQSALWQLDAV